MAKQSEKKKSGGEKRPFLEPFIYIKTIFLPRQAREKHRETGRFSQVCVGGGWMVCGWSHTLQQRRKGQQKAVVAAEWRQLSVTAFSHLTHPGVRVPPSPVAPAGASADQRIVSAAYWIV
jgi:hypothetical protein